MLYDAHDEGEVTLTLRLSNASGGQVTDGEATRTIENADLMPAALLARFGRATAEQVFEHIEERMAAPRRRASGRASWELRISRRLRVMNLDKEGAWGSRVMAELALRDLIPRFEAASSSEHLRNVVAAVQRLHDEGRSFWPVESSQSGRWQRGCDELLGIINELGKRRWVHNQDLPTAFREFTGAFEHTTYRMLQMLDSRPCDHERIGLWCDFAYRLVVCH